MPTRDKMTEEQFNMWQRGYRATRLSLSDSILVLKKSMNEIAPDEQAEPRFQISLQEDKVRRLDTDLFLLNAGHITIDPPSPDVVQKLEAFATQADKLIGQAKATVQAVQLADQAVSLYHSAVKPVAA